MVHSCFKSIAHVGSKSFSPAGAVGPGVTKHRAVQCRASAMARKKAPAVKNEDVDGERATPVANKKRGSKVPP